MVQPSICAVGARPVERLAQRARRTRWGSDHQELPGALGEGQCELGERMTQQRRGWRDPGPPRHDVAVAVDVVDPREPELLDVTADRRLGGLQADRREAPPDLLLAAPAVAPA